VITGAVYWESLSPREPMVNGKSLSYWLEEFRVSMVGGGERQEKPAAAIRQIGTNAIPQLLLMLRERDGKVKSKLLELLLKQRFIRISWKPAWVRNEEGLCGFQILGAEAKGAVPALLDIYERPPSSSSRTGAAAALSWISPSASAAIPALIQGTTNSDLWVRLPAVDALGSIRSEPERVVPALIRCLSDTNYGVRSIAARNLGLYGPKAREAIPALVNARASLNANLVDTVIKQIEGGSQ
jgi:hypothetical protein